MPSQPSQDMDLNSNKDQNHPPTLPTSHPDYQHPSKAWLKNPAWIGMYAVQTDAPSSNDSFQKMVV